MKVFGGSNKKSYKRHTDSYRAAGTAGSANGREKTPEERARIERMVAEYRRKRTRRRIIILAVLLVLILGGAAALSIWIKPPDVAGNDGPSLASSSPPGETAGPGGPEALVTEIPETPVPSEALSNDRNKYSFVIVGIDKEAMNTDTMIVGMFDVENHKLNMVNIPRDTLVNVSWKAKKANTMFKAGDVDEFTGKYLRDLLGFEVDMWAAVDLKAFVQLVDCIGGVYYDVPIDMVYEDYVQDLYIDIRAGYQYLDGEDALKVVRFRQGNTPGSGYVNADLGRIGTQQDFLKTVAKQVLQIGNVPKINEFIRIFEEYVKTDLTAQNVAYFAQEFLKLKTEDIHFDTIPANYDCWILNVSYCSIYLDEWIAMINEYLNPFDEQVTAEHLNILMWDNLAGAHSTTGVIEGGPYSFYDNT